MEGFVTKVINTKTLGVKMKANNWEEAVRLGGEFMVNQKLCTQEYIEAIITNHKTIGPYFVVAPGIAMPHAKPENGVLKTGYAVITLANPVEFGDDENDPVDILIFAGAINREEHNQEAIPQIAELCDNPEYTEKIRQSNTLEELENALLSFQHAFESGELG